MPSTEVSTKPPDTNLVELQGRINKCHLAGKTVQVRNDVELQKAALGLKACSLLESDIHAYFDPDIDRAHKIHKSQCDKRRAHLKPVELAKARFNQYISAYHLEAERQRKLREEKLRREAEEAEYQRQVDELEGAKKGNHEAAETLDAVGDAEGAEALRSAVPEVSEQPVVIPALPPENKPEGLSYRDNWKWRVTNLEVVPRDFMVLNEKMLNSTARDSKGRAKVPGIEFYNQPIPIQR